MPQSPKRIAIVAGEASGDMYGADLTKALRAQHPDVELYGIGGTRMQDAGVKILVDLAAVSVMGFVEVIKHFRIIRTAFRRMQTALKENPPEVLVLIDYPGFNLRLARYAHSLGIKVLYYISPQIWAWKAKRIELISKVVSHMAVILPFEKAIYEKAFVPVSFVGHPLVERVKASMTPEQARSAWGCREDSQLIGLVPGSRRQEISRLLPEMLKAVENIAVLHPNTEFLLPLAHTLNESDLKPHLDRCSVPIKVVHDATYDVMKHSKALLITSGTATLEACLLGTPMVITYKTSKISYEIIKRLIHVQHIGLCNLLAGHTIVPEFIQHEATAENLSRVLQQYLVDAHYYQRTQQALLEVSMSLQAERRDATLLDLIHQL